MKLTKLQRHTAYCILLREFEEYLKEREINRYGFCWTINELFFGLHECDTWENFIHYFPEIIKRKPEVKFDHTLNLWFDYDNKGINKRIKILKECIEETY